MTDYSAEIDEILERLVRYHVGSEFNYESFDNEEQPKAKATLQSIIAKAEVAGRIDLLKRVKRKAQYSYGTGYGGCGEPFVYLEDINKQLQALKEKTGQL